MAFIPYKDKNTIPWFDKPKFVGASPVASSQQNGSNNSNNNGSLNIGAGSGTLNVPIGNTKTITIGVPQNTTATGNFVPKQMAWNNVPIATTIFPLQTTFNWFGPPTPIPDQKYLDAPIKVGQIWQYRKNPGNDWNPLPYPGSVDKQGILGQVEFAVQIDELTPTYAKFTFIKSNGTNLFDQGQGQGSALLKFFNDDQYFRLILDTDHNKVKYGVHCGKCGKYNEYAEFSNNFQCWPCKNGF